MYLQIEESSFLRLKKSVEYKQKYWRVGPK